MVLLLLDHLKHHLLLLLLTILHSLLLHQVLQLLVHLLILELLLLLLLLDLHGHLSLLTLLFLHLLLQLPGLGVEETVVLLQGLYSVVEFVHLALQLVGSARPRVQLPLLPLHLLLQLEHLGFILPVLLCQLLVLECRTFVHSLALGQLTLLVPGGTLQTLHFEKEFVFVLLVLVQVLSLLFPLLSEYLELFAQSVVL